MTESPYRHFSMPGQGEEGDDRAEEDEEGGPAGGGCNNSRSRSSGGNEGVEAGAASRRRACLNASIWFKLSIVIGLLVVVSTGVLAVVIWVYSDHELISEIQRRLTTVATLRREQLDYYLSGEGEKIDLFANRVQILSFLSGGNVTPQNALDDLQAAVNSITDIISAGVYDRDGSLSFNTPSTLFRPSLLLSEVLELANGSVKLALPVPEPRGWTYNLTRGMIQDGRLVGVLVAWLNATKLQAIVNDRTGLQSTGELLVGVPFNNTHVRLLLPPVLEPDLMYIKITPATTLALQNQTGFLRQRDYRGRKVVVAYTPLHVANWALQAKVEYAEAYNPVKKLRVSIIIIIVATLAFGIICSLLFSRVFISPILDLSRVASALGRGDMTARVKDDRLWCRDEIDDLRHTFNAMADQIASNQNTMEHKVSERTRELARINVELARINDSLKVQIEERKRVEVELEKAKDVAIAADRSKSEFLANMSHEIRTPLNGIINCTELCLDTRTSPEQQEYLDLVRFSAKHLLRIITDILDFSKIEAGKLEMEEIQFSLYDQLEHAVSVLAARAHKKGLELAWRVDNDVPDQIIGDPGRLFQVFVNLIGNSIKFTAEGEVIVSASVTKTSSDWVELQFSVRDTGIGIPEHKQSALFQAFSQVDTSTTRLYGGTGLGLVISSKLAAAMGGQMWVSSEGTGSTFYFTSLFHIPPPCELPSALRVEWLRGVPALVVDDNDSSRKILVDTLKTWGMAAVGVNGVATAKTTLQSAESAGKQFKVLLLDMWLQQPTDAPDLVHYLNENPHLLGSRKQTRVSDVTQLDQEANRNASLESDDVDPELPLCLSKRVEPTQPSNVKVQQQSFENQQTGDLQKMEDMSNPRRNTMRSPAISGKALSIVMLTSVDHPDAAKCKGLGIDVHTSKPLKRALLSRALHAALGVFGGQEAESVDVSSTMKEAKSKGLHILVAEDNIVNQRVAMTLLQKWGHTTVLACNGQEAVEKAEAEHFDLVLMDVQMPVCDGLQATRNIREIEKSRGSSTRIPIVAMTAHAMTGDGERCIAAGMDDYVSKPLNAKKLQELLQHVASGVVLQRFLHPSDGKR